jgi:uncharacterized protein (DUF1778 family)
MRPSQNVLTWTCTACGRTRKRAMERDKKLTIRISDEELAMLEALAREDGLTVSDYVRTTARRAHKEHLGGTRDARAQDDEASVASFVMLGKTATAKLFRESKDDHGELIWASSPADAWGWLSGKNGAQLVFRLEKTKEGWLKIRFKAKPEE